MSKIQVGDIVGHTNWPDLTLIRVTHVTPLGFGGEVVYGSGPKANPSGGFPIGTRSLPKGYRGKCFGLSYVRKATTSELLEAGLCAAPTSPRPHAELIKAWADGARIQYRSAVGWIDVVATPAWAAQVEYRIKPAPKADPTREQLDASFDEKMRQFSQRAEALQTKLRKVERDKRHFIKRWKQRSQQVTV